MDSTSNNDAPSDWDTVSSSSSALEVTPTGVGTRPYRVGDVVGEATLKKDTTRYANEAAAQFNAHFAAASTDDPTLPALAPPPEATYATLDEAKDALYEWAFTHGYTYRVLRTKESKHKRKEDKVLKKVEMYCDLRTQHVSKATKSRNTLRKGCGCLHLIKIARISSEAYKVIVVVAGHVKRILRTGSVIKRP
ncbi:hypothetical protein K3495_g4199 [Neofusicoccum parvum]|nr:hypothetical protein K3495_g4199 [Neofusicoccum parvum]